MTSPARERATEIVCAWAAVHPTDPSFDLDIPWSYARLRDLIAAALTDAQHAERRRIIALAREFGTESTTARAL